MRCSYLDYGVSQAVIVPVFCRASGTTNSRLLGKYSDNFFFFLNTIYCCFQNALTFDSKLNRIGKSQLLEELGSSVPPVKAATVISFTIIVKASGNKAKLSINAVLQSLQLLVLIWHTEICTAEVSYLDS